MRYVIEPHRVDDLVLPTGRVVGCDPITVIDDPADGEPFAVGVPPGTYRLVAWVAVLYQQDTEWQRRHEWQRRNAALQLVIHDAPVARWELALRPGQDSRELGDDEFFGYGVDGGIGAFCDLATVPALASWDEDAFLDILMQAPSSPVPGLMNLVADPATGANLVMVWSGWGDGAYPTFLGYTADGEVASMVTDFCVVPR